MPCTDVSCSSRNNHIKGGQQQRVIIIATVAVVFISLFLFSSHFQEKGENPFDVSFSIYIFSETLNDSFLIINDFE